MAQTLTPTMVSTPTTGMDVDPNKASVNDENSAPAKTASSSFTAAPHASTNANGESITVFHDPENFNVKHPLQNQWTLWFTKPPSGRGENWYDLLKEVVTFDSVEEFWGIYVCAPFLLLIQRLLWPHSILNAHFVLAQNNISACSQLAVKSDYHLFKRGVRPEWEDIQNKHGGKWSYQFKDKKGIDIDELWLHAQLAAIGETLEDDGDNEVMGVVINVRKAFFRIGLWTRTVGKARGGDSSSKEALMKIGQRFKQTLKIGANDNVEFSGHTESANAGSTRAKAKYIV